MRIALRELRRRPGRFGTATVVLTLLVVLLLFLGGLLDGLFLGSTGALRSQRADAIVYSTDANDSVIRSRIDEPLRARVEAAKGVDAVGGLGVSLLGAAVPGRDEIADAAVIGYERAPSGVPAVPPEGEAWADRRLRASGVELGQTLRIGPAEVPLKVRGWVDDTSYLLQGSLWVSPRTWREVQNANRPDAPVEAGTFEVLVVTGAGEPEDLAVAVDSATGGATSTLTRGEAVLSLPGTREQQSTFNGIIFVTFGVVGLVVALFFALLTLERAAVYGVLKAIGASTARLFRGLLLQSVVVGLFAFVAGSLLTLGLSKVLPDAIPLQLQPSRAVTTLVGVLVTSVFGGAMSLRRIARIDPATTIGTGT